MSRRPLAKLSKLAPTTQTTKEHVSKQENDESYSPKRTEPKWFEKRQTEKYLGSHIETLRTPTHRTLSPSLDPPHNEQFDRVSDSLRKRPDDKITKITATTSSTLTDSENTTTPEFKLLYKLFVPNKYLIKNNKASMQNLLNHLPSIVPSSHSRLNLEVHIFLATIVVGFVNSWYLTKLNTDNFEFIRQIYQVICDLVNDISTRIVRLGDQSEIVDLVDEVCVIVESHLKETVKEREREEEEREEEEEEEREKEEEREEEEEISETRANPGNNSGDNSGSNSDTDFPSSNAPSSNAPSSNIPRHNFAFKFLDDNIRWDEEWNSLPTNETLTAPEQRRTLCRDWLRKRHVIFEPRDPANRSRDHRYSRNSSNVYSINVIPSDSHSSSSSPIDAPSSSSIGSSTEELNYYRILIKRILTTTFKYEPSPLNSQIVLTLVVHLLGDLVFAKLMAKLSSPEFILGWVRRFAENLEIAIRNQQDHSEIEREKEAKESVSNQTVNTEKTESVTNLTNLTNPSLSLTKSNSSPANPSLSLASISLYFPRLPPKLHNILQSFYLTISLLTSKSSPPTSIPPNIIQSSLFSLINTVTNLTTRRPLLANVLIFARDQVSRFEPLRNKINEISLAYISRKILTSGFLSEDNLCKILIDLRINLFKSDKRNESESTSRSEKEPPEKDANDTEKDTNDTNDTVAEPVPDSNTLHSLVETIFNIITSLSLLLPSAISGDPFRFHGESDEDLKDAIRRILVIFNSEEGESRDDIGTSLNFNKLLIVRLLDCVVGKIYPELL